MSKRGPIIGIGIVAVLLLAAPFALGMLAESTVRAQIEQLNEYPPLSIEVTGYERGWLGSRATVEVRPNELLLTMLGAGIDPGLGDRISAPFVLELGHGPVLTLNGFGIGSYAVKADLDPEADWVQLVTSTLGIPYLVEMRGRAGIGTGFEFEGDIPPFEAADGDETFSFSGLEFSGQTDGTDLTVDAGLERFAVQGPAESLTLEGFALGGSYQFRPSTVALGSGEVTLDRMMVTNPLLGADAASGLSGLRVSGDSSLNEAGNLDFSASYTVDSMTIPDVEGVGDFELGLQLINIDSQAIDDMYAMLDRLYSGAANTDLLPLELLPIASRVVAAGPTFSIDPLRFSMGGRPFATRFSVSMDPTALPTGQVTDFMDPATAMAAIEAELELTSSKELLSEIVALALEQQMAPQLTGMSEDQISAMLNQQARQSISLVVAQGMLRDDGDTYSTTITFADGVATINGIPVPLEAMGLF